MLRRPATAKMNGEDLVIACMDFNFIGGSMGSVVGEKIARSIDYSIANKIPFLMISKSGGAYDGGCLFAKCKWLKHPLN